MCAGMLTWTAPALAQMGPGSLGASPPLRPQTSGAIQPLESHLLAHSRLRRLGPLDEEQVEVGPLLGRGSFGRVYKGAPSSAGQLTSLHACMLVSILPLSCSCSPLSGAATTAAAAAGGGSWVLMRARGRAVAALRRALAEHAGGDQGGGARAGHGGAEPGGAEDRARGAAGHQPEPPQRHRHVRHTAHKNP